MEITSNEYFERQKVNKLFTAIIVIFAGLLPIGSYVYYYYLLISKFKEPVSSKEMSLFVLSGIIVLILSIFITYLFLNLKLELKIYKDGILFRLFPFHRKFRFIPFTDIRTYGIRKYNPILEYGGWGIRYSTRRNGIAYTLSGNYGLQLELNSNKRLLIGVKSPDSVLNILMNYIPEKYIERHWS